MKLFYDQQTCQGDPPKYIITAKDQYGTISFLSNYNALSILEKGKWKYWEEAAKDWSKHIPYTMFNYGFMYHVNPNKEGLYEINV